MKKNCLFLMQCLLALVVLSSSSCKSDKEEDRVTVSQGSVSFGESGGSQTVSIKSNTSWTISGATNWLTVSPSSGSGDGTININAVTNSDKSARTATLTINAGSAMSSISVYQPGKNVDEDPTGSYTGTLKPIGYIDDPAPCFVTITKLSNNTYRLTSLICETFGINMSSGYNLVGTPTGDGRISLKSETSYSIEGSYFQGNLTLSFGIGEDTFFFTGVKN